MSEMHKAQSSCQLQPAETGLDAGRVNPERGHLFGIGLRFGPVGSGKVLEENHSCTQLSLGPSPFWRLADSIRESGIRPK